MFKQRWHIQTCGWMWTQTHLTLRILIFFSQHTLLRAFRSHVLITSSRLIWGQRWTKLTSDYWLLQLITVISRCVIWQQAHHSQTTTNLTSLKVMIHYATFHSGTHSWRWWSPDNSAIHFKSRSRPETGASALTRNSQSTDRTVAFSQSLTNHCWIEC